MEDIPTTFQVRTHKTLEYKHPAWLDDIMEVTKVDVKKHYAEVRETMKKLENAGFSLNPNKCEFFKREIERVGHKIDQQGIRPLQDNLEAITKRNTPKNKTKLKCFLGAIQYPSNKSRTYLQTLVSLESF